MRCVVFFQKSHIKINRVALSRKELALCQVGMDTVYTRREGYISRDPYLLTVVGGIVAAERKRSQNQTRGPDVGVRVRGLILGSQGL